MQIKRLTKHGNSVAIVIDKAFLRASNLDENAMFQVIADSSGIIIQSVKPSDDESFSESLDKVLNKYAEVITSLSDK